MVISLDMKKIKIILEAGVNHNGSLVRAKKMIKIAKKVGADYVKFQSFITDELVLENAKLANYQKKNLRRKITQYHMLKKLEISKKTTKSLINYCKKNKIKFLSSVFGIKSFNILHALNVNEIKIPSGEINNIPLLDHISNYKKKIILSTGMANLDEVEIAIKTLTKKKISIKDITILHCNTDYPTKLNDVNLKAMTEMGKKFNVRYGYSDHTNSQLVPIVAATLGATIIEKHFTLSKKLSGPDHKASMNIQETNQMLKNLENTIIILGKSKKEVTASEKKNIKIVRKSVYASKFISKGDYFSLDNLKICRPGVGKPPAYLFKIIGKKSSKNYKRNQLI